MGMLYQLTVSSILTARDQNDVPAFSGIEYIERKSGGYAMELQSEDAYAFEVWRG
jgi:hypothetical protein